MSATMSGGATPIPQRRWRRNGIMLGVCSEIAERADVPVWLPRAAFILFAIAYCWLQALIVYGILAFVVRRLNGPRPAARFAPPPPRTPYGFDDVRERFHTLDQRLANLEACAVRSESELRRAFRDLERK